MRSRKAEGEASSEIQKPLARNDKARQAPGLIHQLTVYYSAPQRLNTREPFVPPKPKLFESA